MRTRTLLLLAVACGAAILAAGAALFLRLAGQDEPVDAAQVGEEVTVGDLRAVVESFDDGAERVEVLVTLGGVADPDAIDGFALVTPAGAVAPDASAASDPPPCQGVTVADQRCTLVFVLPADPGTTRVLVLRRGEEQRRWDLVTA